MQLAIWHFFLRILGSFDRIPAEDCIKADPMQQYMMDSEAEWQVAYLEYCLQLDPGKHYIDKHLYE